MAPRRPRTETAGYPDRPSRLDIAGRDVCLPPPRWSVGCSQRTAPLTGRPTSSERPDTLPGESPVLLDDTHGVSARSMGRRDTDTAPGQDTLAGWLRVRVNCLGAVAPTACRSCTVSGRYCLGAGLADQTVRAIRSTPGRVTRRPVVRHVQPLASERTAPLPLAVSGVPCPMQAISNAAAWAERLWMLSRTAPVS